MFLTTSGFCEVLWQGHNLPKLVDWVDIPEPLFWETRILPISHWSLLTNSVDHWQHRMDTYEHWSCTLWRMHRPQAHKIQLQLFSNFTSFHLGNPLIWDDVLWIHVDSTKPRSNFFIYGLIVNLFVNFWLILIKGRVNFKIPQLSFWKKTKFV